MIALFENEKVVYEARKHWIVLVSQIVFLLVLALVPFLFLFVFQFIPILFIVEGNTVMLLLFIYFCWLNIIWICLFYVWTNYKLTLWIITEDRLIMIYQQGFFNRDKKEIQLEKIQDITVEQDGLLAHIFGFGNLSVTTASETGGFLMDTIPNPDQARIAISTYLNKVDPIINPLEKNVITTEV